MLGIRDNPWFFESVPRCIQLHSEISAKCSRERSSVYSDDFFSSYGDLVNVHLVDLSDEYCSAGTCPPYKNNILMYRDSHHLSTTYTFTLKDILEKEISVALHR